MVQPKVVNASLYFFSKKSIPALPNTNVAEITADTMNKRSIIIGA